jgi:recombination protein RecT
MSAENVTKTETKSETPARLNGQTSGAVEQKTLADSVLAKVQVFAETGNLNIPKDYSAANAIRLAWLILQETKTMDKRPVLEVCTKESVANALLKMIIKGLNPAKSQCAFIAYGNQLTLQEEYAGKIAIAKRVAGVKRVVGNAVFKGDEFSWEVNPETLVKKITKHVQTLESLGSGEVVGAYAIKEYHDGKIEAEVMSMTQIRKAWEQGQTKGQSPAHKNFPDQMAIKTVIGRLLKIDINSSDDSALFEGEDEKQVLDRATEDVAHEISENANTKQVDLKDDQQEDNGANNAGSDDSNAGADNNNDKTNSQQTLGPGF